MSDQGGIDVKNDVNGREEMVSIRCLEKATYGSFWRQGKIRWRVQMDNIEGRIIYQRSRFEGGTEPVPHLDTRGIGVRLRSGESLL